MAEQLRRFRDPIRKKFSLTICSFCTCTTRELRENNQGWAIKVKILEIFQQKVCMLRTTNLSPLTNGLPQKKKRLQD